MAGESQSDESFLGARAHVPAHVVHRDFRGETVVLNLESGMYHGLNPTAARMLEALEASPSVQVAVELLARELEQAHDLIERDVLRLCRDLDQRGLVEFDDRSQ